MRLDKDSFKEITHTIARNKLRSFLTAFGVFWGVLMLVILIGGGLGTEKLINGFFESAQKDTHVFFTGRTSKAYNGFGKGRFWNFTIFDVNMISAQVKGLGVIIPIQGDYVSDIILNDGKKVSRGIYVQPWYPKNDVVQKIEVVKGRMINDIDQSLRRNVCVIGEGAMKNVYGKDVDPCGEKIVLNGIAFKVVGVVKNPSEISFGTNPTWSLFMPEKVYTNSFQTIYDIDAIHIQITDRVNTVQIKEEISNIIKKNHNIAPDDKTALSVASVETIAKIGESFTKGINFLVWLVGIGTLIAGVIGVSNIMIVSVKERTSEIGIRRAIGAKPSEIIGQILAESVIITLVAGMIGMMLGVFILNVLDMSIGKGDGTSGFIISLPLGLLIVFIISILGLVAGLLPAFRAMEIKPIDAIREE